MSAIGRVFIVFNLALAFAFVGFAGTYLQRSTDWKAKHKESTDLHDAYVTTKKAELDKLVTDYTNVTRQLSTVDSSFKNSEAQLAEAKTANEKLNNQLSDIEGDLKKLRSDYATIASNVQSSTEQSQKAFQTAMEMSAKEKEARDAQVTAQGSLRDAQAKIADLENKLSESNGMVGKLTNDGKEKDVLIAYARQRVPGVFENVQPDFGGRVHNIDDAQRLVTVEVTNKSGDVKPGYTMALHDGKTYKGDMVIEQIDGSYAMGKVTRHVSGASIKIGDQAHSRLAGSN
jgi:hypothetical protein